MYAVMYYIMVYSIRRPIMYEASPFMCGVQIPYSWEHLYTTCKSLEYKCSQVSYNIELYIQLYSIKCSTLQEQDMLK